jgi:hypothetical protein
MYEVTNADGSVVIVETIKLLSGKVSLIITKDKSMVAKIGHGVLLTSVEARDIAASLISAADETERDDMEAQRVIDDRLRQEYEI